MKSVSSTALLATGVVALVDGSTGSSMSTQSLLVVQKLVCRIVDQSLRVCSIGFNTGSHASRDVQLQGQLLILESES